PFKDVLIHGIVRDELGRKMSKSLDNGIDPLEVIAQYGADALRYALVAGLAAGNDLRYKDDRVEAGRNFINKIWNAFRFAMMNLESDLTYEDLNFDYRQEDLAIEDKWILNNLQGLISEVTYNINQYDLGVALSKIYNFLWENFCDWYIEMVKPRLQQDKTKSKLLAQSILNHVLCECIKLLHPFMPYFSEEIYKHLLHEDGLLIKSNWPEADSSLEFPEEANRMELLIEIVHNIRNIRAEMNIPNKKKAGLLIVSESEKVRQAFIDSKDSLNNLARVSDVKVQANNEGVPETAIAVPFSQGVAYMPLEDLIDLQAERNRLLGEIEKHKTEIARAEKKLANKSFVEKAPQEIVKKEEDKLKEYQEILLKTKERLDEMN
ncbi:MAG TPA: class I tRNA ligase family protein, partial [Candidatus Eisenbacteria bacterium]|nr:class I tRNA ligase family protein [Candidatus Eisenbacteria bacterium]